MNERPIALITWGSGGGPFPRVMRWLAEGLRFHGRRVDIVFMRDPKGVKENPKGIREIGLGTRARTALIPLLRYMREVKPTLVIVAPAHCAPVTLLAGRLCRVPVVPQEVALLRYDLPYFTGTLRYMLPFLRRVTYRWSPAIAAVSSDVADAVQHSIRPAKHVHVLPNAYSDENGHLFQSMVDTRSS
jgi:hypothetical protein